ncbi:MAG: S41 family peptidase [Caldilineae bacterium]|nr:S41 family peptidase [Anaerolineae bacterium]MCB9154649.1 S41 family peptidase [Caldilineae bacterium]
MDRFRSLGLTLLTLLTLSIVFLAGFGTHWLTSHGSTDSSGNALTELVASDSNEPAQFGVFWEAWHVLQRDFFGDQPADQQRTYAAIQGLAQSYDDPYTYFVEPQPRQREKENLSGEFGGIGAWVSTDDQGNIVLKPMPGRAAEAAGIQEGDILAAVDGVAITPELSQDQVLDMIRGPIGEPVELQLQRGDTADLVVVSVVRERVETPSVEWMVLEETPTVGYIAIHQFTERTVDELDSAIEDLDNAGISFLVLDLRHNGGGLLQSSIDVASRFLSDGVVLFERKKDGSRETYRVVTAPRAPSWPTAVLVDGATASAAEIVAGALQDRGRAQLVGEKTYGKGSVQLIRDLSDGSSVHVTVARWQTPNGHEINGVGLTPDIEALHQDDIDAPLAAAIRLLTGNVAQN